MWKAARVRQRNGFRLLLGCNLPAFDGNQRYRMIYSESTTVNAWPGGLRSSWWHAESVILSAAKDLACWQARFFAALRMTVRRPE
jgi:hypothetical protein